MTKHTVGTKAHCDSVSAAANKLMGYPKQAKGGAVFTGDAEQVAADAYLLTGQEEFVPVPGPDVEMPTYAQVRKHPVRNEYAYPVTEAIEDAYLTGGAAPLTLAEDELLFDALDYAEELPADWDPDDQGDDDG
jgi:hypothetical protein